MKAYKVPSYGRTSKGLPMVNLLPFEEGEFLQSVTNIKDFESDEYLFFTTKKGRVKRTEIQAFKNIRANGIRAIELRENDELLAVRHTNGTQEILLGASNGKAIRFLETDVRPMGRTAAGVTGMRMSEGDEVIGAALIENDDQTILAVTQNGYGKRSKASLYRLQQRGGKGVKTVQVTEKNGPLVKLRGVNEEDDLVLLSNKGMMIRLPLDQISETGRATQGVRLMRLQDGHQIANIAIVPKEEKEEQLELEDVLEKPVLKVEETPQETTEEEEINEEKTRKTESLFDLLDEE